MSTTEIAPYDASPLDERMRYAETLANAGDLIPKGLMYQPIDENTMAARGPKRPSPGKILLVMETGAMLGLHPIAALQGIHVIEGKASLAASTMSAVVRQAGHDLKVWTEGSVADGTFRAVATLVRKGEEFEYRSAWDAERAGRAGLLNKDNWKNYFEAMCKNRAVSDVCRDGASDTLAGVIYTPDELGATVNERDEVLEGELVEPQATALPKESKRPAAGKQGTRKAPAAAAVADEPPQAAEPVAAPEPAAAAPQAAEQPEPVAVTKARVQAKQAARAAAPEQDEAAAAEAEEAAYRAEQAAAAEAALLAEEAAADMAEDPNVVDAEVVPDDEPMALAASGPHPFDVAHDEEPKNWLRQLAAATDVAQAKQVWDESNAVGELSTDLRQSILTRKAEFEAA